MAKTTLPTNYKDDILNSSMGGKRRYKQTTNADGTVSLEDASTYDQVGSNFGASQLNAISKAVNESADSSKIISDPDTASATTEQGYIADVQLFNHLTDSLGGFSFKTADGKKQVSTDGGSTWENFSSGAELLWTNPAPLTNFAAQTVSLDLSNYDAIVIEVIYARTYPNINRTTQIFPKNGESYKLLNGAYGANESWTRTIKVDDSGVTISSVIQGDNGGTIPYKIYGLTDMPIVYSTL